MTLSFIYSSDLVQVLWPSLSFSLAYLSLSCSFTGGTHSGPIEIVGLPSTSDREPSADAAPGQLPLRRFRCPLLDSAPTARSAPVASARRMRPMAMECCHWKPVAGASAAAAAVDVATASPEPSSCVPMWAADWHPNRPPD